MVKEKQQIRDILVEARDEGEGLLSRLGRRCVVVFVWLFLLTAWEVVKLL